MLGLLNIRSALLYDPKVYDFKILFGLSFNSQEVHYNLLNKYVIYKINQYQIINIKNYSFWESIQIDFVKFEVKYF